MPETPKKFHPVRPTTRIQDAGFTRPPTEQPQITQIDAEKDPTSLLQIDPGRTSRTDRRLLDTLCAVRRNRDLEGFAHSKPRRRHAELFRHHDLQRNRHVGQYRQLQQQRQLRLAEIDRKRLARRDGSIEYNLGLPLGVVGHLFAQSPDLDLDLLGSTFGEGDAIDAEFFLGSRDRKREDQDGHHERQSSHLQPPSFCNRLMIFANCIRH